MFSVGCIRRAGKRRHVEQRHTDDICCAAGTSVILRKAKPMPSLTVATTQFALRQESNVDEFLDHMDRLVSQAVARGAEVVVFPELASTGLLASITGHQVTTQSITADYWEELPAHLGPIMHGISAMAKRHNVTVVGGSHNRVDADGTLRNTAYIAHPDGRVESQDKTHLTQVKS